ncbi:hypothetical protein NA78x_000611 [Anatilimnocola sp. NA78]|uniref:hypothetical protein n=1 Tax=Anatilimnocola sp. NA78 TaxID=3415683 RepID=UPI003CE59E7E
MPSTARVYLALLLGSFFSPVLSSPLAAQDPVDRSAVPVKASDSPTLERNLLERTGWIRLELIGGRIAVLGHRCGQSRVVQVGEPTEIPSEQLSVQLHSESLVIHYEDFQPERQLTFDLDDQQRLTLTSTGSSPTADVKLVQPFKGPLTVTMGRDKQQTYTAATLWHLMLKQPHLCEEALFPMLETLRPHWRLQEQAAAIEQSLIGLAGKNVQAERTQWRTWVQQLDSDDFQQRQQADTQLRAAGQPVVSWLQRLDRRQLSAEQASRVREICHGLADLSQDTPQRVAGWMVDDRCAWFALLNHDDSQVRLAASNHLSLLCGKPLAFDPNAQFSDRQQQIAQLQLRFSRP